MKPRIPAWLRALRRPRDAGTISVELVADTSRFEDAMLDAAEGLSRSRYRQRIRHERSLGQAYVDTLLDQLCRDFGLDPVTTWRLPRQHERQWKRDMATWRAQQLAALAVATVQPDLARIIGGSGT